MIKIKTAIKEALSDPLEDHFCELVRSNWGIEKIDDKSPTVLFGFFETPDDAAAEYGELRKAFPALPESYDTEAVNDADWQNEYKKYLKPWDCRGLHWVPVWMKGEYRVPESDKALYFDAGMAFGTGDHPTTRLCAMALIDALADNPEDKSVIDAGCGSGILAISAYLWAQESFRLRPRPRSRESKH